MIQDGLYEYSSQFEDEVRSFHYLYKWDKGILHQVDYEKQEIVRIKTTKKLNFTGVYPDFSGSRIVGSETVLDYSCQKIISETSLGSSTFNINSWCLHDNALVLSRSFSSDVVDSASNAVDIKFDIELTESDFSLPNYPIVEAN